MEVVADYLRKNGLKATATCSYAFAWLKKNNKSNADIISKNFESVTIACKIDGKH